MSRFLGIVDGGITGFPDYTNPPISHALTLGLNASAALPALYPVKRTAAGSNLVEAVTVTSNVVDAIATGPVPGILGFLVHPTNAQKASEVPVGVGYGIRRNNDIIAPAGTYHESVEVIPLTQDIAIRARLHPDDLNTIVDALGTRTVAAFQAALNALTSQAINTGTGAGMYCLRNLAANPTGFYMSNATGGTDRVFQLIQVELSGAEAVGATVPGFDLTAASWTALIDQAPVFGLFRLYVPGASQFLTP